MTDKDEIRALFSPLAVLRALTPEAGQAVPDGMLVADHVAIRAFPFRVGRESRGQVMEGRFVRFERPRFGDRKPNNDLYLIDAGPPFHVSREHFLIERTEEGYFLVDRGSACGTGIGSIRVGGGDKGGSTALRDGDTISVGTAATPYRYAFVVLAG